MSEQVFQSAMRHGARLLFWLSVVVLTFGVVEMVLQFLDLGVDPYTGQDRVIVSETPFRTAEMILLQLREQLFTPGLLFGASVVVHFMERIAANRL